jgi:uncharacterized glyoxalase superfamily protein PhnB
VSWVAAVPELRVRDVPAAQRWYCDLLGFAVDWTWHEDYASISIGDVELFLTRSDAPGGSVTCVFVEDPDAVYAACREGGATIVEPLEDKPWGMREFTVADPDGNRFRIGRGDTPAAEIAGFTVGG